MGLVISIYAIKQLLTKQEVFYNFLLNNTIGSIGVYTIGEVLNSYLLYNTWGMKITNFTEVEEENLEPVVYIYNTFQTDKYRRDYYYSYSVSSYVKQASYILQEYLRKENVESIVEEEQVAQVLAEENISYSNSYAASLLLLERRKEETPTLAYYFDLQVSDYAYEITTTTIDGVSMAKILFVVGTDNDMYQQNYAFATALNAILEDVCPELSRGVDLRGGSGYQGVYNQDFASTVLLIQVGGVNNTIAEVNRSLQVLAEVIAKYIKEDSDAKES